jgi:hypothetical protein
MTHNGPETESSSPRASKPGATRFLTVSAYARLCGVTRNVIQRRAAAGHLVIDRDKDRVGNPLASIDVEKYPPQPKGKPGRPPKDKPQQSLPFVTNPIRQP